MNFTVLAKIEESFLPCSIFANRVNPDQAAPTGSFLFVKCRKESIWIKRLKLGPEFWVCIASPGFTLFSN